MSANGAPCAPSGRQREAEPGSLGMECPAGSAGGVPALRSGLASPGWRQG